MQVLSVQQGAVGSKHFLRRLFPKWSDTARERMDFVLVTLIGALMGMILLEPHTSKAALAAGLSWVAAFQGVVNIKTAARMGPVTLPVLPAEEETSREERAS
jgi:hypothetical protein